MSTQDKSTAGTLAGALAATALEAALIALLAWAGLRGLGHPVGWWTLAYLTAAVILLARCMVPARRLP